MNNFFPPEKRFDQAIISLYSKGYVSIKKVDNVQMINIEDAGIFAYANDTLKKEQYKIWWTYIKDGGMLFATLLMAWIAIKALNKDTSKFVEKSELKDTRKELLDLKSQAYTTDSLLRIYLLEVDSIKKSSFAIDTPALKNNR